MTQEQIELIRAAQKKSSELEKEQSAAHDAWEAENLDPLVKACDHKYPWGESAMLSDYSASSSYCRICGKSKGSW